MNEECLGPIQILECLRWHTSYIFIPYRKAWSYFPLGPVCLKILCWLSCTLFMWQLQETVAAAILCQILEERSLGKMVAIKVIFNTERFIVLFCQPELKNNGLQNCSACLFE